jgi:hypothetical protein
LEWLVYCFRASGIFYEFISAAERSLPASWRRYSSLTVFITKGLSHRDWQMFLAVELQLRLIALAISAPVSCLIRRPHCGLLMVCHFGFACRPLPCCSLQPQGAGGCAASLSQCPTPSTPMFWAKWRFVCFLRGSTVRQCTIVTTRNRIFPCLPTSPIASGTLSFACAAFSLHQCSSQIRLSCMRTTSVHFPTNKDPYKARCHDMFIYILLNNSRTNLQRFSELIELL